jgi:hypothetical protein
MIIKNNILLRIIKLEHHVSKLCVAGVESLGLFSTPSKLSLCLVETTIVAALQLRCFRKRSADDYPALLIQSERHLNYP